MTFLARMAEASRERVRSARARESEAALERRAFAQPPAPALELSTFDVIAELKLRSPAAGTLAASDFDPHAQLTSYVRGGAAAVSVLTEPTEFKGELAHLAAAAAELARVRRPASASRRRAALLAASLPRKSSSAQRSMPASRGSRIVRSTRPGRTS